MGSELVFQRLLTDNAIGAIQETSDFVMWQAFNMIPSPIRSFTIPKFSLDDLTRCEFGYVGLKGDYPVAEVATDSVAMILQKAGLDQLIFDSTKGEIGNDEETKTMAGVTKAYRFIEKVGIAEFLTAGKFNDDQQGVAATPSTDEFLQFDNASSTPIKTIRGLVKKVHRKTGLKPDSILVTSDVHEELLNHSDILGRLSGFGVAGGVKDPDVELLKRLFGVKNYYVTEGIENTSNKGNATQTKALQATKKMLIYRKGMSNNPDEPSAGRIAYRTYEESRLVSVYKLRDDIRECDIIRAKADFDAKVQMEDLGILLYDCIA